MQPLNFEQWFATVDGEIHRRMGLDCSQFPDQPWQQWFDEGMTAEDAATRAINLECEKLIADNSPQPVNDGLLDILEELLGITEQFKDQMEPAQRDRWLAISAVVADQRDGEEV